MLSYLEIAASFCKTSSLKAILLRFVLRYNYRTFHCSLTPLFKILFRFQMEMLHREEEERKEIMLTNMAAAYTTTREAESNDHFLVG